MDHYCTDSQDGQAAAVFRSGQWEEVQTVCCRLICSAGSPSAPSADHTASIVVMDAALIPAALLLRRLTSLPASLSRDGDNV